MIFGNSTSTRVGWLADEKVTARAAALEWLRAAKEVRGTAESDGAGSPSKEARCAYLDVIHIAILKLPLTIIFYIYACHIVSGSDEFQLD